MTVTSYFGEVFKQVNEDSSELVGKFELYLMLVGLATNEAYEIFEIFDMNEYTFRVGKDTYDFENCDLKEDIVEFYDHNMNESRLLSDELKVNYLMITGQ